jgi:hypothetical protein
LYWYRTPPNIRVGRRAFDEFARRALERQYPDIPFDWDALANTPIPPVAPDVEKWRERRRQERAARQAAREEAEVDSAAAPDIEPAAGEGEAPESGAELTEPQTVRSAAEAAIEAAQAPVDASDSESRTSEDEGSIPRTGTEQSTAPSPVPGRRRRRRRRRGGGGSPPPGPARE